ncbi:PaaI family thioesterase [Thermodesulfobacteriota bacterium]
MAEEERKILPKLRGGHCFGCGSSNPIGLDLDFYRDGQYVCADVILKKHHEGWQNMAHGGIVSTLLDEVMSWTVLCFKKAFFVTRKMEVKYIKPVLINGPLRVKGQIVEGIREPFIEAKSEIVDQQETVLARGHGRFVEVGREKLKGVSDGMKDEMLSIMNEIADM